MSTLYVDHRDAELRLDGKALTLYAGGERVRCVPLALLERIALFGHARLDTRVIGALAEDGIALTFVRSRDPERRAVLLGPAHNDAEIRLAQYRLFHEPVLRLRFVRLLVRGKLRAYQRFLRGAVAGRPDVRYALTSAIETLGDVVAQVGGARHVEMLRGLEGAGARAAFSAYAALVPDTLGFRGRRRRPPPDPVNALLSLTYTLLFSRSLAALHGAGLDPAVGMLHEPAFGRASLAADQVELWRARADAWVWRLVAERELRAEHFSLDKGACLLNKAGRQRFYRTFETWAPVIDRGMRRQARALVRWLRRTG